LKAELLTRNDSSFEELEVMSKEISKRAGAGRLPSIKNMSTHQHIIAQNFHFEGSPSSKISINFKYDNEYRLNARLNEKEIAETKIEN
jgi:hypothetical protein